MSRDFNKRVADRAYYLKMQQARRRREKIDAMISGLWVDVIAMVLIVCAVVAAFAYL